MKQVRGELRKLQIYFCLVHAQPNDCERTEQKKGKDQCKKKLLSKKLSQASAQEQKKGGV